MAACLLVAAGAVTPTGAGARQAQATDVALALVDQPPFHGRDDRLGMQLRVTNLAAGPLDGFLVQITAHPRASSRYALRGSLEGDPGFQASVVTADFARRRVAPGSSTVVELGTKIAALESLTREGEGGVYPLTLAVYSRDGSSMLDSVRTALIYYPKRPQTPLYVVTVVPINDLAARAPDGVFYADRDGRWPLEDALAEGGWLNGLLSALESAAAGRLRVAIAPSPRLLEEVADMSGGYRRARGDDVEKVTAPARGVRDARRFLRRLRDLAARPTVQPLLVPYASPDLPVIGRASRNLEVVPIQISAGEAVLRRTLERDVERNWLWPPDGRLDAATLEQLRLADAAEQTFLAEESLEQFADPESRGCPALSPTFACPAVVGTRQGPTQGYVTEPQVQELVDALAHETSSALELQKLLAETAMVHAELPGKPRVLAIALPSGWRPPPDLSLRLLRGLADAPWLEPLTPAEGLDRGLETGARELVDELPAGGGSPGESFYEEVNEAEEMVRLFSSIDPPGRLLETLQRNVLVAQSRDWWGDDLLLERGLDYATEARQAARRELDKIGVGVPSEVTLTSQRGRIDVSVFNETGYPVRLQLSLYSPKLGLDRPIIKRVFPGAGEQVPVRVTARSSGMFPLAVRVETPEGHLIEGPERILVRSTTFNDVALAITLGALAFLVLFYVLRGLRGPSAPSRSARASAR